MRLPVLLCVALSFMALSGREAAGATILYTDRAAFEAAIGNFTLITFDDPVIHFPHTTPEDSDGFIVTYDNLVNFWFDISGLGTTDGSLMLGANFQSGWATTLQPMTAFGFDIISTGGFTNLILPGNNVTPSGPQFIGVVSDTPLSMPLQWWTSAPFSSDPTATIDNLTVHTVPEPATWFMFALGCVVLYYLKRRAIDRR